MFCFYVRTSHLSHFCRFVRIGHQQNCLLVTADFTAGQRFATFQLKNHRSILIGDDFGRINDFGQQFRILKLFSRRGEIGTKRSSLSLE